MRLTCAEDAKASARFLCLPLPACRLLLEHPRAKPAPDDHFQPKRSILFGFFLEGSGVMRRCSFALANVAQRCMLAVWYLFICQGSTFGMIGWGGEMSVKEAGG